MSQAAMTLNEAKEEIQRDKPKVLFDDKKLGLKVELQFFGGKLWALKVQRRVGKKSVDLDLGFLPDSGDVSLSSIWNKLMVAEGGITVIADKPFAG